MQGSKSGYFQSSNKRKEFDDVRWSNTPVKQVKFREKTDNNKQVRRAENRRMEQNS